MLQEKVLYAILEFKIKEDQLGEVVNMLRPVLDDVDTVVSWGLATRFAEDGSLPVMSKLEQIGLPAKPNAKITMDWEDRFVKTKKKKRSNRFWPNTRKEITVYPWLPAVLSKKSLIAEFSTFQGPWRY